MSAAHALPFGQKVAIPKEAAKSLRMVSRAEALVYQAANGSEDGIVWPPAITQALDKLTFKQRQYTIKVAAGMPKDEAYTTVYDVAEGRSGRAISGDLYTLNHNQRVIDAIGLLKQYLDQSWLLDVAQVKDYAAARLYEESATAGKATDRIKATELLLRMNGGLVDHKVITHIDGDQLDTQEALLKSILADVELIPALETSPAQLITGPDVRPTSCPRCGGAMVDAPLMGDGDGI